MKLEVKSSAILIITLLLGVALGMVLQGRWRLERTREVGSLQRPQGFVTHMEEIIQPRADQRDAVLRILRATAERNKDVLDSARVQLRSDLARMQDSLAPLLDEAQRQRLSDFSKLPDPFPPPPGGDPGGDPPPPDGAGRRPPPRGDLSGDGPPPLPPPRP